jgi:hypothetical protein
MGGGLMQLVAYGAQDVYLSGTPQITFWKVVYRRHTNFSIETIEQSIDAARPGGKYTVTVTRNGDLASNACLKVKLAALTPASWAGPTPDKIAWVRRLGHAMVTQVKVEIGGSTIDTHVGTWLDLWYELTHKTDQERGYRAMIGDVPELTELRAPASGINAYTVYIPFQFWFCRNTGLALPLIALQYHEVRFHIEMESIQKLIVWQGSVTPTMTAYTYQTAAVMIDYVYLDSEERRKFAQVGHEYLIEEVQHNGGETLSGSVTSAGASINQKFRLNFNHPCKELVWALKCGAFSGEALTNSFSGGKTFLGYTHDDDKWDEVLDRVAKGLAESCVVFLSWSDDEVTVPVGYTRGAGATGISTRTGKFVVTTRGVATNLDSPPASIPAGSAIGIRTSGILMGDANAVQNLFTHIVEADLDVDLNFVSSTHATAVYKVTCTRVVHTLTMELLSLPSSTWTDGRPGTSNYATATGAAGTATAVEACTNLDSVTHVVQPHNYGLNLDGSGNFVSLAKIELNGHDRFDWQEGSYFNYVQPRAHTRTPADGVNVYCFGLHPENHQPSGSANLSRIDTTILNLTMKDSKRPTGSVLLDWVSDSKLHIFALNYNVLRVMSGMAGKAYSN